jgi:hypothetical protein
MLAGLPKAPRFTTLSVNLKRARPGSFTSLSGCGGQRFYHQRPGRVAAKAEELVVKTGRGRKYMLEYIAVKRCAQLVFNQCWRPVTHTRP